MVEPDRRIYGLTGEVGRDGILTIDQQALLNLKQHEAARAVLSRLEQREADGPRPIAVMATGIGKTRVEHEIIETWKSKNPKAKILFIAGTKLTLVDQSSRALSNYQLQNTSSDGSTLTESENLEEDNTETEDVEETLETEEKDLPFYRVGRFKDSDVDVQVATIQTIQSAYKRGELDFDDYDLVIVDEVHNIGTPTRSTIVRQFKNVAGFTATSNRNSGPLRKPEQYGFEVAYNLPLPEAQELRLLPPLLGMQVDTTGLVDEIPTTRSGNIDYKKLEEILKKSPDLYPFIADRVSQIIKDGEKEYKTVIACNFVLEAYSLAQLLKAKGVTVGVAINDAAAKKLHSEEIPTLGSIDRYKLPREDPNSIQVLISPYVASEGFDAPYTEVLVWASPTDSDLRYTQYVGRLARRSEGKLFGVNVDFLYQTSQFGWSYNMGMWMKGNIRQLPNGLLYLGPEQDIAGLSELEVVKNMRARVDNVELSELQRGQIEEVQDTDLIISYRPLRSLFVGDDQRLSEAFREVITLLRQEDPNFIVIKRNRDKNGQLSKSVTVCQDRERFIDEMILRGFKLREKQPATLEKNKLAITSLVLPKIFTGRKDKLWERAKAIQSEYPEMFDTRTSGGGEVVVCNDETFFIDQMQARGSTLRPKSDDQGIELTTTSLAYFFRGDTKRNKYLSVLVSQRIEKEDPELMTEITKSGNNIRKCLNRKLFIQYMIEAGATVKN